MLKCIGCDKRFLEKEGLEETPRGISILDLVCPECHENLEIIKDMTSTELMFALIEKSTTRAEAEGFLPLVLSWNAKAYQLPGEIVEKSFKIFVDIKYGRS